MSHAFKRKRFPCDILRCVMMKKLVIVVGMLCGIGLAFWGYLQQANDFQVTGQMNFVGLDQDVDIRRDDYGVAYILAKTDDDLWRAQGFVTAQHRLFQMTTYFTMVRSEMSSVLKCVSKYNDF